MISKNAKGDKIKRGKLIVALDVLRPGKNGNVCMLNLQKQK